MKARHPIIIALILGGVLLAGKAGAFEIRASVIGNGGNVLSGAAIVLQGTVGQAAVGLSTGAGNRISSGFWFSSGTVVSVDPHATDGEFGRVSFGPATPTPTRGVVSFSIRLPRRSYVSMRLYDVSGRWVATVLDRSLEAGQHQATLGRDFVLQGLRTGIYFSKLLVDGRDMGQRRMVVIR